jgi:diguanylate cyclase (GGDEF)-like protein/PAS domain S-box-containing protein
LPLRLVSVLLTTWLGVQGLAIPQPALALPAAGEREPGVRLDTARDFRYQRIGAAEGLAQSSVYALLQDHHGFVWMGTQDGLQRWDGYRFELFGHRPYEPSSLPHGMVHALLEDRSHRLWVGTFKGLARLDKSGRGFERPLGEEAHDVAALLEDKAGDVWVGTRGAGLFRLSAAGGDARQYRAAASAAESALPGDQIHGLYQAADGSLYVGGAGQLHRLRSDGESFELIWQGPDGFPLRAIREDGRGRLWVGTEGGGLLRFEPGRLEPLRLRHRAGETASLAGDQVTTLLEDRAGRLWVGLLDGGLDLYHEETESFSHLRHDDSHPASLSQDSVRSLIEDASGLLWVGTSLGGVTVINPRPGFGVERAASRPAGGDGRERGLPAPIVRGFLEDSSGVLWVATDGGGVASYDPASGAYRPLASNPPLAEKRIWTLFEDRSRNIWIGAQNGLYRFDPRSGELRAFRHDHGEPGSLGAGGVRSIVQDQAGRLWVALFGGGLSRLGGEGGQIETFRHQQGQPFGLPSNNVVTLFLDRKDHLWVGTAEGLARRTSDGRFHLHRHDPKDPTSLLGDVVRAIHQDGAGNLWVGTDAGLNRLGAELALSAPLPSAGNNRGFKHFTQRDGLPNDTVYAILEDGRGKLWLSTNRGLARFDPATARATAFDLDDGLQGLEFNGGAALRARDGRLFFGGVEGYNVFQPEALVENGHRPPVVLTRIRSGDHELETEEPPAELRSIRLGHRDNMVSFEFAALDFSNSRANRYRARLLGFEEEWRELGTKNDLTFTNLAPGTYRLEVQGSNDDGLFGEEGLALEVAVAAPPWSSAWAFVGYSAAGGVLAAYLWRESRRRRSLRLEIDEVMRTSERRLNLALLGSGDGLWDWDISTGEIHRSRIAEPLGYTSDELPPGHDFRRALIHADDQERVEQQMTAHLRGETPRFEAEYRVRDKSGAWHWILDRGNVVERDAAGRPLRMAGTFKDMSAHKEVEAKLRLWSTVFRSIGEGVVIIDTEGLIKAVNPAFCRLAGWQADELVGQPMKLLEAGNAPAETYAAVRAALEGEGRWQGELEQPRKDGTSFTAFIDFNAVRDDSGRLTHFVAVFADITRRKQSEEELRYLANYDTLTNLPNRTLFQQKLEQALAEARESGKKVALLFGDLDQFKGVNDTLGHAVGDLLLQETSRRLLASVRRVDTVARLGGDEFTVLLGEVASEEVVVRVAERILKSIGNPFHLDGHEINVSTSLGISVFPVDGQDGPTLLKHADTAMYEAKERGRSCYCFYTQAMSERAIEKLTLENRLRRAVQNGELRLAYQPKYELETGRIIGVEALLRWQAGDGPPLLPGSFIELAEQSGLIVPIGQWVLEEACRQATEWREAGLPAISVAVNVSAHQLAAPGFVDGVADALERGRLEPGSLLLELTESALMDSTQADQAEQNIARMDKLKRLGVQLSIDDFGTGYSSLSYLMRLPIDEVKIDRSFLKDLAGGGGAIVRAILAMAASLGLRVVAEGVETAEQVEILKIDGCRQVQGYFFARPMPPEDLAKLLAHP